MQPDDRLYKAFLEEMQDLENFRMAYTAAHPGIPLDRDDPDVKRLIEAMAFFAARTHMAGMRNIIASRQRIFQQFFPYLLTPKPAMGIIQAKPTGQFVEPAFLPKGAEIIISPPTGGAASFRTLADLSILPISLTKTNMLLLPDKGFRLLLQMQAPYPRSDDIGQLSFHINHLNDYLASLRVFHTLKKHIQRASVVFDKKVSETTLGKACSVSFGLPWDEEAHPLQKEQMFFHFPQQDLYLNLEVASPPRNWSQFTIILDLDEEWPRHLNLNKDVFQLFTIPVVNLKRAMAQPLIYDGTKERYPIRHAELGKGFELHSVLGVYKIENQAMVPIRPGIIAGGSGSYEIERALDNRATSRQWLNLHLPQAFQNPQTIAVEALWLQPWFSETISQKQKVAPYSRNIVGLEWELVGSIVPHADTAFMNGMDDFLHLITLKNKSVLSIDDLIVMLQTLGANFYRMLDLLTNLKVEEIPVQKNGPAASMFKYYLQFKEFDPAMSPLVETFMTHVGQILDAWISVEVRLEVFGEEQGRKVAYEK